MDLPRPRLGLKTLSHLISRAIIIKAQQSEAGNAGETSLRTKKRLWNSRTVIIQQSRSRAEVGSPIGFQLGIDE